MVKFSSSQLVEYYRRHLGYLANDELQSTEAAIVLIARSQLADQWALLSEDERNVIESLDEFLARKYDLLACVLPSSTAVNPAHWWWRLHEGPHVRDRRPAVV